VPLRLRKWLGRIAPIYPGEGPVVLLCLAVNFVVFAGIMFGRNSRDSLFLVYFGIKYLPYMYFANAVSIVGCSLLYTTLVDRIERGRFLGGVCLLFVAGLVTSRLILFRHPHWFFPVLYIEAQVIWIFSLMLFWTFTGDLFDTRQAKRLFPVIAVGGLLGMIGVGLFCKQVIRALGTENLLLVWAGLVAAGLILGGIIYRRYRKVEAAPQTDLLAAAARVKPSEWQKMKEGFREVGREPLQRSMAGYVLLLWTVFAIVDFCYSKTVRARYPQPDELATFFGRFVGAQGLFCLAIQLFLTRPVIARFGVGTTINFHPAILFLGTTWMSLRYGFASVVSTKLADASMLYTFSDSSYQLLYSPLRPDRRARVRGFIEGYIRPLSLAAAGVLILVGNNYLKAMRLSSGREFSTGQQLSWGAIVLATVWLGIALTAKKGYIRTLLRNLQGDSPALRLAAATALAKLKDPASLALLSQTLQSENPERIVTAVQFLESYGTEQADEAIAALLAHPDERVRATAASALGRRARAKYIPQLTALLRDPNPRVRANSIEALAAGSDGAVVEQIRPLLQDPFKRVHVNALLALAAVEGVPPAGQWLPLMRELAQGDPEARSTAIFALSRLPSDESVDMLAQFLKDPVLRFRAEAAKALGRIGSPRIIPPLIDALGGGANLRHAARRSLASIVGKSGGAGVQELVQTALSSPRPEIRSELADVLGRLQDPQVTPTLLTLLKDPEWRVQWKVLKSFEHRARVGPLPENARAALFQYASNELTSFRQSVLCSHTLVPQPASTTERMLALALEEDRTKIEERVFHMLGILCGREQMQAIFAKLQSSDARQKADALEALDNLAPKIIGRQLLGLLEPPPAPSVAPLTPAPSLLSALTQHSKAWVRACTAYYLGEHPAADNAGLLQTLLADRDAVVRETALYAGWQAFREAWRPQVDAAARSADPALHRATQRILAGGPNASGERSLPMLLTVEKVLLLKSAPLFAGLDSEELAALADIALEKEFAASEIIFDEGSPAHHLYILLRGKVEVFRRIDSTEYPIATLGEKECFGELAMLDDEPRSASIRALEPVQVLKIDRDSFRELISERPQISFAIFKILSSRLRHGNLEIEHAAAVGTAHHYA
jgi:HEAT repeat protein